MLAFLTGGLSTLLSTVASGIIGPVFAYLGKREDTNLEGFKTAAGLDTEAYKAALDHNLAMAQLQASYNGSWWGPKALYMIVGLTASLHSAAVFIDSTLTFGTGHYGNLGVPPLPGIYATYEQWVVASLFFVSLAQKVMPSLAAAWMKK